MRCSIAGHDRPGSEGFLDARYPRRLAHAGREPAADHGADLPDRDVHLDRRRGAGRRRQRRTRRVLLFAPLQPDEPRPRRRLRRDRRCGSRHLAVVRHGRGPCGPRLATQGGRPGRRSARGVRLDPQAPGRHLHAVRRQGGPRRHDRQRRRSRRHRGRTDAGRLRRDHRQPDDRGDRPRDGRAARARARGELRGRQHLRLALRLPADRTRCGPRHRIGDQVPWWSQRPHRRRRRRPRRAGRARSRRSRTTRAAPSVPSMRSSSCAGC